MDTEHYEPINQTDDPMLCTINLPYDLKLLDKRLPRSNYGKPSTDSHAEISHQRHASAKPLQNSAPEVSVSIGKSSQC